MSHKRQISYVVHESSVGSMLACGVDDLGLIPSEFFQAAISIMDFLSPFIHIQEQEECSWLLNMKG
jgi:hypothetical protein